MPHLTFRWRLTLAFGSIAFGAGTVIVGLLWLFMRFVPTYLIAEFSNPDPSVIDIPVLPPSDQDSEAFAAFPITDVADLLETLLWAGAAILLVISALAGLAGWIISGKMLTPLAAIGAAAKRAGEGALDHRIQLGGPRDEIRDLADTFDSTLDRLERAFTAHERFAMNAAHELRTPLTATKTLLDIARAHPDAVDHTAALAQLQENNDRSIGTVEALLSLTSTEASQLAPKEIDLLLAAQTAIDRLNSAATNQITLSGNHSLVSADPVMLELLFNNLLQNAVRHNDSRRTVTLTVDRSDDGGWFRIENTGPRIQDDEVAKLTEPLYRSQRSARDGYGLGLTIVRSIADAHNAELTITARREGGLSVRVLFRAVTTPGAQSRG